MQQPQPTKPLFESRLKSLKKTHQGKVRDIYEVDADHLLIVTTDRLSAFDVILPDPIPCKGEVLTQISLFWFGKTRHIIANHLSGLVVEDIIADPLERQQLANRSMIVKRLRALPIEAVVRGYLSGSGFKDYVATQAVCGIALPAGLRMADRLPEPIFTPASKAPAGRHDENIDFEAVVALTGRELATRIRSVALQLYEFAARHALARGIIIADTKFEFGVDAGGQLTLIDEALTPDSSRFWPMASYRPGTSPPSFDKQYVRDYLESLHWDKRPPAPHLPPDVIERTSANYRRAYELLTAQEPAGS
ncbi:MAG: phosphoribosylaminoimidazolesuccinocarboxamide synthase [Steroidobacterales bacterium]